MTGPRVVSPVSLGWLRRSDLDSQDGLAWEQPDGTIHIFPPGLPNEVVVFGRGKEALQEHLMNEYDKKTAKLAQDAKRMRHLKNYRSKRDKDPG